MLTSPTVREAFLPESFGLEPIIRSKITDVILITSAIAMIIIGSLAASGVFTAMNQANALYLSYGMFGGATFCILAEAAKIIFKLVRGYCNRSERLSTNEMKDKLENVEKIVFRTASLKESAYNYACIISYNNRAEVEINLDGPDAYALIQAVGSEKCSFDQLSHQTPEEHFLNYAPRVDEKTLPRTLKKIIF